MSRVRESQHVPCKLDRKMLETSTCANKGNVVFPRVLNGSQRSVKILIRAARTAKQSLKFSKIVRLIGRQPHRVKGFAKKPGRVLNAVIRGDVSGITPIEVADDANPSRVPHNVKILTLNTSVPH